MTTALDIDLWPRRLALWTLLLMVAVTGLSAFIRHSGAGLGCNPGPVCLGAGQPVTLAVTLSRGAHRVAASSVLLLVIAMLFLSLRAKPVRRREAILSSGLLLLALLLAALGVVTPGSVSPAVVLGNLLGGFLMGALALRLLATGAAPPLGAVAGYVAALLLTQIASGAYLSARMAGAACRDIVMCLAQARGGVDDALLQGLHRLGAVVAALALLVLGALAVQRQRRVEGWLLWALLASQLLVGLFIGSSGLPLPGVLLHNLGSALLLATVVRLV